MMDDGRTNGNGVEEQMDVYASADALDELRADVDDLRRHVDRRLDAMSDEHSDAMKMAVEAIRASNAQNLKWIALLSLIVSTIGTIAVTYLKMH